MILGWNKSFFDEICGVADGFSCFWPSLSGLRSVPVFILFKIGVRGLNFACYFFAFFAVELLISPWNVLELLIESAELSTSPVFSFNGLLLPLVFDFFS